MSATDNIPPAPVGYNHKNIFKLICLKKETFYFFRTISYQKTFKLFSLCDVNPAVLFNDFDVLYFVVESSKGNSRNEKAFDSII